MAIILSGDFMFNDNKKVVIIGVGMVGMSYAYALLNQNICDELVLVDINKERAKGEAMDLSHGLPFAPSSMKIKSGEYSDCADADLVVICAGAPQENGETRRDLLMKNYKVFKSIVEPVVKSGFNGVFLVASNPVDIMTQVVYTLSGFPANRVLGSGTTLDSARLRHMMSDYFKVNPRNVHAYVIGEHGDSEFVPWSNASISVNPLSDLENRYPHLMEDMHNIAVDVRESAYEIIKAKRATYYGIGMAAARIAEAIVRDSHTVMPVSVSLNGEYGLSGLCLSIPAIVGKGGAEQILEISFSDEEMEKLAKSANELKSVLENVK